MTSCWSHDQEVMFFLRVGACHGKYHLAEFGVSRSSANREIIYQIYDLS